MKKILLVILSHIGLLSCSSSSLAPEAYVNFIKNPDNGLHQVKDAGKVKFDVQFKPLQYVCLLQNNSNTISGRQLKTLEEEFAGLVYFNFSILGSSTGDPLQSQAQDSTEYKGLVNYLSFSASKDFWVLHGPDTLKCVLYHYERNYGLASRNDVVLAFQPLGSEKDSNIDSMQFCFNDKIFHTGTHSFNFSAQTLLSIPELKTN